MTEVRSVMSRHPTETDELDDEFLAALGESRLTEVEEDQALARLRSDPEARSAFRDLYPARFAALFGHNVVSLPALEGTPPPEGLPPEPAGLVPSPPLVGGLGVMPPVRPAWRLLGFGLLASFAVLAALVMPARRPGHTGAIYDPERTRGVSNYRAAIRPPVPLMVDLGEPTAWDALRGRHPWGAVIAAGEDGRPFVLATTARPGNCTVTPATLACLDRDWFSGLAVVVSTGAADVALDALVSGSPTWQEFVGALKQVSTNEPWSVHFPLEFTSN
jgi:hypothetical protein